MFINLLQAFAFLAEADALNGGDEAALRRLLVLMDECDPWLLITRQGPETYALLRHFGLIAPHVGQERMEALDPELACRLLLSLERWRLSVLELEQAQEFMAHLVTEYQDTRPRPSSQ